MQSNLPVYVGLDYHRRRTQVCVVSREGEALCNRSVASQTGAIVSVIERCGAPAVVAIEACSGAAQLAHELIEEAGLPARLTHPGYVNRMRHNPDKSDLSDARLLAELGRSGFLPEVWLAPEPIRDLRSLTHERQELVDQRRRIKVRILALLRERRAAEPPTRRWTKAWLEWLRGVPTLSETVRGIIARHLTRLANVTAEIEQVEAQLRSLTADDPVVRRLLTLPGIGPVTAWTLRADIGRFDRFRNGKQLARYCGLSPRNASSGERMADAGLVKAGRAARRADPVGAPAGALRRAVAPAEGVALRPRQADQRGDRGRGQPLGPLAAPSDDRRRARLRSAHDGPGPVDEAPRSCATWARRSPAGRAGASSARTTRMGSPTARSDRSLGPRIRLDTKQVFIEVAHSVGVALDGTWSTSDSSVCATALRAVAHTPRRFPHTRSATRVAYPSESGHPASLPRTGRSTISNRPPDRRALAVPD